MASVKDNYTWIPRYSDKQQKWIPFKTIPMKPNNPNKYLDFDNQFSTMEDCELFCNTKQNLT